MAYNNWPSTTLQTVMLITVDFLNKTWRANSTRIEREAPLSCKLDIRFTAQSTGNKGVLYALAEAISIAF